MEGRMTACNMSIEWGAKAGMVAPDDTTFSYLELRPTPRKVQPARRPSTLAHAAVIIPKQFLKRIERTGYGPFLFNDWRANGDFPLDRPEHRGASVLVTGENFGCGSSREHVPWAIQDAG